MFVCIWMSTHFNLVVGQPCQTFPICVDLFRFLASHFSLLRQRKVTKRKATPQNCRTAILHSEAARRVKAMDGFHEIVRVSCAFRKIHAVPMPHPCRIVTKTHVLCVLRKFSCNARRTPWELKSKAGLLAARE